MDMEETVTKLLSRLKPEASIKGGWMKQNRINVDWLKDKNFDDKYYTQLILPDGSYHIIGIWTDEQDIIEGEFGKHIQLKLNRYYTPTHARWINDDVHKGFRFVHNLN